MVVVADELQSAPVVQPIDHLAEQAFSMVGGIEQAIKMGKRIGMHPWR